MTWETDRTPRVFVCMCVLGEDEGNKPGVSKCCQGVFALQPLIFQLLNCDKMSSTQKKCKMCFTFITLMHKTVSSQCNVPF